VNVPAIYGKREADRRMDTVLPTMRPSEVLARLLSLLFLLYAGCFAPASAAPACSRSMTSPAKFRSPPSASSLPASALPPAFTGSNPAVRIRCSTDLAATSSSVA